MSLLLLTATFIIGVLSATVFWQETSKCLSWLLFAAKKLIAYFYLRHLRKRNKHLFNYQAYTKDFYESGLSASDHEWFFENPRPLSNHAEAGDTVEFWGIDNSGNALVVHLTRRHNRRADICIYLRLESGEEYTTSIHPHTCVYNVSDKTFSAAGLTLEMLEPLRRWRIIFKGLLRKGNCYDLQQTDQDEVEVSVNFIWSPAYHHYVLGRHFNLLATAKTISALKWSSTFVNRFKVDPDERLEQWGRINGLLQINADERLLKLWAPKIRAHGLQDWKSVIRRIRIHLHAKDGTVISLRAEDTVEGLKNLMHGYIVFPSNFGLNTISKTDINLEEIFKSDTYNSELNICLTARDKDYILKLRVKDCGYRVFGGSKWECEVITKLVDGDFNGEYVTGFIEFSRPYLGECNVPVQCSVTLLKESDLVSKAICLALSDPKCRNSNVAGGKGASLAMMMTVKNEQEKFEVPNGVCLTKNAFSSHLHQHDGISQAIKDLENCAWGIKEGSVDSHCQRVVDAIKASEISQDIKNNVKKLLVDVFGDDFEKRQFAVRSSAIGEDGEEVSAAGQNETFLGVIGFDNICQSVANCWASQFSFRSVEYKRQNGQLLNAGMAVVIQEMIPSDISGVLFTDDPVSGSFGFVTITANYGLGESVVSGLSDPDVIVLKRGLRDELSILKKEIGKKNVKIILKGDGGVEERDVDSGKSDEITMSDEMALRLGKVAVFLEQSYASPRDIEWAIVNDQIFLLQCRPITTYLQVTQHEILHEFDSPLITENELFTRANVGEVMPGALCPLTISTLSRLFIVVDQGTVAPHVNYYRYNPLSSLYFGMITYCNHFLMDRVRAKLFAHSEGPNPLNVAFQLAIYGRIIDDSDEQNIALKRFPLPSIMTKINTTYNMFVKFLLQGKRSLDKAKVKFENYEIPTDDITNPKDLYVRIQEHLLGAYEIYIAHIRVSSASMIWNLFILNILSGSNAPALDQYNDFASLIGKGVGAISGDLPTSLKKLAKAIIQETDAELFKARTSADIISWLQSGTTGACLQFQAFLKRHGHRGNKEFDLNATPIRSNLPQLIEVLKTMVSSTLQFEDEDNKRINIRQAINNLQTKLSRVQRLALSILLPICQNAIINREASKTLLIKLADGLRTAYLKLGEMLMKEGKLVNPRLIFFFTHAEIGKLINNRPARLINRAVQRQKCFPHMDSLHFPEFLKGDPRAIEEDENNTDNELTSDDQNVLKITGFPVCQGIVEGPAKVILSFTEIHQIKQGDILITVSTDIAWSPYFPMLSGVVTEIGGLVSHGAVVAREYGLPCIVAAKGATKIFKSGETVLLNASKGTLEKLSN